jgi:hypothetical protein
MNRTEIINLISKYSDSLPFTCNISEIIDTELDINIYCEWASYLHELKKHDELIGIRDKFQKGRSRIIYKYNDDIRYDDNIIEDRRNYMILSETTTYFAGYW